jgi:hypothetical protein
MLSAIITVLASLVGVWAVCKYIIFIEVRIDSNTFKTLYDYAKNLNKFILNEEFTSENRHPILFYSFIFPQNIPFFYVSHSERLMQAGWHSKDYVSTITCLRWDYKKIKEFLNVGLKEISFKTHGVPVQVLLPFGIDKIGSLKEVFPEPLLNKIVWEDLEKEIDEMVSGRRNKTGALLYGTPGNGKTSLVKYLATKYKLPIMIFILNPEWSNHDILLMFSNIPKRCIVLMEDFDNYFNKRDCILGSSERNMVKFSFDVILNGLDGVYNSYEQVAFIMTANDIEKVDDALKNRPSRFKFAKHIANPDILVRKKLLKNDWAEITDGLNLDQICRLSEYQKQGLSFSEAMQKLDKTVKDQHISRIAETIYRNRLKDNKVGTAEKDWIEALELITSK